ncbi:unnamed protein product [Lathyrus sativus]|nr:unnamed protein product [Lathyrus sativus]
MASIINQFLLLFLWIVIVPIFAFPIITTKENGVQQISLHPKTTVRIYNHLGGYDFDVHCKSKNDDLGNQLVHDNEYYQWDFHPNIWGSTLFYCHISWTNGEGTYDIYKQKRDFSKRCKQYCDWYVTKDGIQGFKQVLDRNETQHDSEQDTFLNWESRP